MTHAQRRLIVISSLQHFFLSFAYVVVQVALAKILTRLQVMEEVIVGEVLIAGILTSTGMCMWGFVWVSKTLSPALFCFRTGLVLSWVLHAFICGVLLSFVWPFAPGVVGLLYLVACMCITFAGLWKCLDVV